MKHFLAIGISIFTVLYAQLAVGMDKDPQARTPKLSGAAARSQLVTLTNGTGDGKVSITVDGYGSFGSSTPADDAIYDPIGAIGPSGTVYESAVYFSPRNGFLTTDTMGGGIALPPISMNNPDARTAISQFNVAGFHVKLTQKLLPATSKGSTLVQTYVLTNNTGSSKAIKLVRHVDGDLYFAGGLSDDYGGVSADGKTLYEFDSGDSLSNRVASVRIQSSGGTNGGFTIQPFRLADDIMAAKGIPTTMLNKIYNDANNNKVTDSGYDVTLSQQNNFTVANGQSVTYQTSTIFGEGSINDATAATSGCAKIGTLDLRSRLVTLRQTNEVNQTVDTDANGCYSFANLVSGKNFSITVPGPTVTATTSRTTTGCVKLKGLPMSNRVVTLRQTGVADKVANTNANGCYTFNNMVVGKSFNVIISGPVVPASRLATPY